MTEETNMRINEIIDKGMTREQMQANINTSMTATRNALQKYAQRQKDIATINYFLSDKVKVTGHSTNVMRNCRETIQFMLVGKWWEDTPQGYEYWADVHDKLIELEHTSLAH